MARVRYAAAPAAPPRPRGASARTRACRRHVRRAGFEGTPGRMRGVAAPRSSQPCLRAGGRVLLPGRRRRAGQGRGQHRPADPRPGDPEQLVRADADATNAFLVGGLEPAASAPTTRGHLLRIELIAEAAGSQPADGQALGALNEALLSYASTIEQARANNRQALPSARSTSGRQRRVSAPTHCRRSRALGDANNQRVEEEFDNAGAAVWWLIYGLLALAVLVLALVWLARRTRRYVNLPLAAAAGIVFVALVAGSIGLGASATGRHRATRRVRRDPLHGPGPHRRLRRQVEREPVPHRPRLGRNLRDRMAGIGQTVRRHLADLSGTRVRRPRTAALGPLRLRARRHPETRRHRQLGRGGPPGHLNQRDSGNATFARFDESSGNSCPDSVRTRPPGSTGRAAGCPSLAHSGWWRGSSRPCSRGGACRSAWRSTGDPATRHHRPGDTRSHLLMAARARQPATTRPHRVPTASAEPQPRCAGPRHAPAGTDITTANCLRSYAPDGALPAPRSMPAGSYMSKIQRRGRLIAGVSADTLLLGARNPVSGKIEGFDIDLLHAVSQAIFGDPDKIELRVVTAAQRIPVLQDGSVDIIARNMTIKCERWKEIAFSGEYYRSGQKVLIRLGERHREAGGSQACVTSRASGCARPTARRAWRSCGRSKDVEAVGADAHTGCLVLFQEGRVDAITGDDTVLAGLAAQDPYAEVVPGARLHRRTLRTRDQPGERGLRPVREPGPRGSEERRPLGRQLPDLAGRCLGAGLCSAHAVYGRSP